MSADLHRIMPLLEWYPTQQRVYKIVVDDQGREVKWYVEKVCNLWYDTQGDSWGLVRWKGKEHPEIVYGNDLELDAVEKRSERRGVDVAITANETTMGGPWSNILHDILYKPHSRV